MWLQHLSRRLWHPLVLFGATAAVLFAALAWLAWRSFEQDQALAEQRIQRQLDHSADLVAAALRGKLSDFEEQLGSLSKLPDSHLAEALSLDKQEMGSDALIAVVCRGRVEAYPRANLRYYPVLPAAPEVEPELFAAGEDYEFRRKDYAGAAAAFQELASSEDDATRAWALVRLGRVLRKANDPDGALKVYGQLAELGAISVEGVPAELLARHARCVLQDELAGRRSLWVDDIPVLLVWQAGEDRLLGLAALPRYVQQQWLAPVQDMFQQQGERVALADADGRAVLGQWAGGDVPQALRTSAQTRLPWTLQCPASIPVLCWPKWLNVAVWSCSGWEPRRCSCWQRAMPSSGR